MEKPLSQLLQALEQCLSAASGTRWRSPLSPSDGDTVITSLVFDSRAVKPGSLFFALPGTHVHGNTFILQAMERGAAAVIYQDQLPDSVQEAVSQRKAQGLAVPPLVQVPDSRFAMSPIADCFYDSPSSKLVVIGVTGTEGKSSTVSFVWQLLRLVGKKAGFISTVQYSLGGEAIPNPEHQTTPEAPIVQRQLQFIAPDTAALTASGADYQLVNPATGELMDWVCHGHPCLIYTHLPLSQGMLVRCRV